MDDCDKEKKIEKRMKKLTKYTPEKTFTIEKDRFHGTYYKPGKGL